MGGRATRRVVRSIVAPALGVSIAALAAGAASLEVACNREGDGSGPYTGPVGMVPPAHNADAEIPVTPGIVAVPTTSASATPTATAAATGSASSTAKPPQIPPPGIVPQKPVPQPPGMVPRPTGTAAIPGMPPMPQHLPTPAPEGSGMLPGAAAASLADTASVPRPARQARRATDRDESLRFGALASRYAPRSRA